MYVYTHVFSVPLGPMHIPKAVSLCSVQKPVSAQGLTLPQLSLTLPSGSQDFPGRIGDFKAHRDLHTSDPNTNFPIPTLIQQIYTQVFKQLCIYILEFLTSFTCKYTGYST